MLSFRGYITEMPHLQVGDDILDLELEVHANMKPEEYLDYYRDILEGKQVESKVPGQVFQIHKRNLRQAASELLDNSMLFLFTRKHYGKKVERQLENLIKEYL